MRAVAGHLVHHLSRLSLCRPALAALRDTYPFTLEHGPREAPFSAVLMNELRVIRGLVPIIEGDLGRDSCMVAFCSDSSTHGYPLHETRCHASEMLDITVWRERWRFVIDHPAIDCWVADGLRGRLADVPDMAPRFEAWFEKEMRDLDILLPDPEPPPRCPADARPPPRVRQEVVGLVPQLPTGWVQPERWHRVVAGAWRRPEAIHNKEARAALLGLRRATQQPRNYGRSLLSLGDNLSEIMAFDRGRARSYTVVWASRSPRASRGDVATWRRSAIRRTPILGWRTLDCCCRDRRSWDRAHGGIAPRRSSRRSGRTGAQRRRARFLLGQRLLRGLRTSAPGVLHLLLLLTPSRAPPRRRLRVSPNRPSRAPPCTADCPRIRLPQLPVYEFDPQDVYILNSCRRPGRRVRPPAGHPAMRSSHAARSSWRCSPAAASHRAQERSTF